MLAQDGVQIENSNFEIWQDENNPLVWNILSVELVFFDIYFGEQTTDASSGDYAIKLETENIVGLATVPGLVSLGEVDLETLVPEGGIPFQERPQSFSFDYKYQPASEDAMGAFLFLSKWNEDTQQRDTIGGSVFYSDSAAEDYTRINLPVVYFSEEIPDSINVGFTSSTFDPVDGSILYIDSLSLGYENFTPPTVALPATNVTPVSFTANWMPSPVAESFTFQMGYDPAFSNIVEEYEDVEVANSFPEMPVYKVQNILPGKYYYRVQVNYWTESSDFSNTIAVGLPTAITDFPEVTFESISLWWKSAVNAEKYLLQWNSVNDFTFVNESQTIDMGTDTTYTLSATPGEEYYFRVGVIYHEGDTVFSAVENVTTPDDTLYELCLNAQPNSAGTVTGAGIFAYQEEVTITAEAYNDYRFMHWKNDVTLQQFEESSLNFFMPEYDVCFTAYFEEIDPVNIISENTAENSVVFPNPVSNMVTVKSRDIIYSVQLVDLSGKPIKTIPINKTETEPNTSNLNSGVYFLIINTSDRKLTRKIHVVN